MIELKEVDNSKIIAGDFNAPFSIMNKPSREKINEKTEELNNTIKLLDLLDTYSIQTPKQHYTHSSQIHFPLSTLAQGRPYVKTIKPITVSISGLESCEVCSLATM